jgi:predicted type IV restriction endonuclease
MDLIDKLGEIAKRVKKSSMNVLTEEATKTAFVLPFLQALGYDIFDPTEVVPEYTSDFAMKKGEKVDYAVRDEDKTIFLIECKTIGADLEAKHAGQLFRYFSVNDETKFGILTDGIRYLFFSDLEKENVMDQQPFFEFSLLNFNEVDVDVLKKFTKNAFDLDEIVSNASNLKYQKALKEEIQKEFSEPSEEFVRLLTKRVYSGSYTQQVKEQFTVLVHDTLKSYIKESVNSRLQSAYQLDSEDKADVASMVAVAEDVVSDGAVTTDDELEGFRIVRSIASEIILADRIFIRDSKSYCAILLDDNNRRTLCRFYFGKNKRSVVVFTPDSEDRFELDSVDQLYKYKNSIHLAIKQYEQGNVV